MRKYYSKYYERSLSEEEIVDKKVRIKMDPYRVCDILEIGGGAREQIIKKAIRWTDKGDDEKKVLQEIIEACVRKLDMLEEDGK